MSFRLVVFGRPAPAGSKKAFTYRSTRDGQIRASVTDDSKGSAPWKKEIRQAAGRAIGDRGLLEGPLKMRLVFYVARPKSHYGSGRNAGKVKPSAPAYPAKKPDVLKLARAVEDALTGIVYRDDSQIVVELLEKYWGTPERVEIDVRTMDDERG